METFRSRLRALKNPSRDAIVEVIDEFWASVALSVSSNLEHESQVTAHGPVRELVMTTMAAAPSATELPSGDRCEQLLSLLSVIDALVQHSGSGRDSQTGEIRSLPPSIASQLASDEQLEFRRAMAETVRVELSRWTPTLAPILTLATNVRKGVIQGSTSGQQASLKQCSTIIRKWKSDGLLAEESLRILMGESSVNSDVRSQRQEVEVQSLVEPEPITMTALKHRKRIVERLLSLLSQLSEAHAAPHWKALKSITEHSSRKVNDEHIAQLASLLEVIEADVQKAEMERQHRSLATAAAVVDALKHGGKGSSSVTTAPSVGFPHHHARTVVPTLRSDVRKREILPHTANVKVPKHVQRTPFAIPVVQTSVRSCGAFRGRFLDAHQWLHAKDFGDKSQVPLMTVRMELPTVGVLVEAPMF